MFGFRPDGRRLKDVDPLVQITPYLMPMRCDAQVFLEHKADYEKMAHYIAEKNRHILITLPSCANDWIDTAISKTNINEIHVVLLILFLGKV